MKDLAILNRTIEVFFELNPSIDIIPAKDLMPQFIKAGIFDRDTKMGLPIRRLLRALDNANELHLIHRVFPERKDENTYWFFTRERSEIGLTKPAKKRKVSSGSRKQSDEHYILDLCDEVLTQTGERQHRFDFLLGDEGKDGHRVKLPVDIYYVALNLVIEYKEQQHALEVKFFDKPEVMTVSGISRGDQRKKYDQLRLEVLPQHGIQIIELFYSEFTCDSRNRIIRDRNKDVEVVRSRLASFVE